MMSFYSATKFNINQSNRAQTVIINYSNYMTVHIKNHTLS